MELVDHPLSIGIFAIVIAFMLFLDLGVFNKKSHSITNKEAVTWSLIWISLSMIFSGVIYWIFSADSQAIALEKFSQFQSAYWIEKALSVDNLFVFIVVFGYFKVSAQNQHKVLFYGILGALIMRAVFIFSGVGLIKLTYLNKIMSYFGGSPFKYDINIVMTLFGLFLVYAGIKTLREALSGDNEDETDYSQTAGAKLINRIFKGRVTEDYVDDRFVVKKAYERNGVVTMLRYATPLLVVVGVIEFTDLLFAVDSIPAIFAIAPNDPFILYTSNIFAILGLRSLYFLLANFIHMFKYLPYGLSVILAFIGVKMLIAPIYHIESVHSLLLVVGILAISIIASMLNPSKEEVAD